MISKMIMSFILLALDVVVESAVLVAVFLQKAESVMISKVLELD